MTLHNGHLDIMNDYAGPPILDEEEVNAVPAGQETVFVVAYLDSSGHQQFCVSRMTSTIRNAITEVEQIRLALNTFYSMIGCKVLTIQIGVDESTMVSGIRPPAQLKLVKG